MALNSLLDPVLSPLLSLGPFYTILIVCLFISLLTTIIYKYTTDQEKLKELKADMKRLQKKATAFSKDGKSDKAMAIQKDLMKMNMTFMKSSFRSTLFTFLPIILFFGWLSVNLAFAPLAPMADFNTSVILTPEALEVPGAISLLLPANLSMDSSSSKNISDDLSLTWSGLKGPAGNHELVFKYNVSGEEFGVPIIITSEQKYLDPIHDNDASSIFSQVHVHHDKLIILSGVPFFEHFPVIKNWGWFGIYFLFAIGFSIGLKKWMKLA
jgi:uncharacterized membrane protein (DUF106 family)